MARGARGARGARSSRRYRRDEKLSNKTFQDLRFNVEITHETVIFCRLSEHEHVASHAKWGSVFLRFSGFHVFGHGTVLSLTNSRGGTCYPPLPHSVISSSELEDGLTRHLDAHVRVSCTSYGRRAPMCTRVRGERVCPVCQESVRGVRERYIGRGKARGGRIDIKIVTEFRRAATYPNALSSPLNYPFSTRVLPFLPPPVPAPPRLTSLLETAFPFYAPFRTLLRRETCACSARYRPGKTFSTGAEEENTVVNHRSKFPAKPPAEG